jgi:hypothetical protein
MSRAVRLKTDLLMQNASTEGASARRRLFLAFGLLFLASLPTDALAASNSLNGSWSGGGWVSFSSGQKEHAHCRARFSALSAGAYSVNAVCATDSGKVSQSARVRQTGANTYAGSFHNREYDVSGSIHITVHGGSQSVRMTSDSGSAALTLRR